MKKRGGKKEERKEGKRDECKSGRKGGENERARGRANQIVSLTKSSRKSNDTV